MGLKDLRLQVISLEIQWITKATEGNEPEKIFFRNNISRGHPSKASSLILGKDGKF